MLTIGGDVEVFVRDKSTKELDSAIYYLQGTKKNPQATAHGFVQYDNVLAEFNIEPADSPARFERNTSNIKQDLQAILLNQGKYIDISASHHMPDHALLHPEARVFGCEPDYNVWALEVEEPIDALQVGNFRTAGGHIHIGWEEMGEITVEEQMRVAKNCDLHLGLPSVLMDDDVKRRSLYGKAGHFRPKPYGIEYRVLSNFWIKSPTTMRWAYKQAVNAFIAGDYNHTRKDARMIERAINTSDKKLAETLLHKYGIEY